MLDLEAAFEKFSDEYNEFDRVENKLHSRPDLCAFLFLDTLQPSAGRDLIQGARHEEMIFLDVDCEALAEMLTEDDVLMLVRCGVQYEVEEESLAMYL